MGDREKVPEISMAFYHKDGLVPAWKQAIRFAGQGGRIATLPDIIDARLATKPGSIPWERFFTTTSAEYMGRTRGGNRILIIAHGVGPMATLNGILKAYRFEYGDKTKNHQGGRISYDEFYALESGKYGEVAIVDLEKYFRRYRYPFIKDLRISEALFDELLYARFGNRAEEYVGRHAVFAREWHRKQASIQVTIASIIEEKRYNLPNYYQYLEKRRAAHLRYSLEDSDPPIITMGGANNCPYGIPLDVDGLPLAHLLSIGGLAYYHFPNEDCGNLAFDVSCHEWRNGVRLASVCAGAAVTDIRSGTDNVSGLLRRNWRKLMKPVSPPANVGFRILIRVENNWFTEYLKRGVGLDTGEPEFPVTSLERIGDPVEFVTTISGYHGSFNYGINEVRAIAPRGANAYTFVSDPEIVAHAGDPKYHRVLVQFYKVEIDTSQCLIREDELLNDYETLIGLALEEK